MNLIFFLSNIHLFDIFTLKCFLKKFCEVNNNITVKLLILINVYNYSNEFIFSDIPNLEIKIYDKYIDDFIITTDAPFSMNNNNIYINGFVGVSHYLGIRTRDIECNIYHIYNYFNNIIKHVNNNYNTNYNLIPENFKELSSIPYTNIDDFLEFKKNKKIIFYYNVLPCSGQPVPIRNHDIIIEKLADFYKDYYIICSNITNVNRSNVFDTIKLFKNKYSECCENAAKNINYALNSDYIIIHDVGVCYYILNDKIYDYKGKIIHINNEHFYYNVLSSTLNINNYKELTVANEEELSNNIHKIMEL